MATTKYGNKNSSDKYGEKVYITYDTTETSTTYAISFTAGIQAYTKNITLDGSGILPDEAYIQVAYTLDGSTTEKSKDGNIKTLTLSKGANKKLINSTKWTINKTHSKQTLKIAAFSAIQWLFLISEPWYGGATEQDASLVLVNLSIPATSKFTITYNLNGATGHLDSTEQWADENITLPNLTDLGITRTGYDFIGWGTKSTGGILYQPGSSFHTTENITLYAIWQSNYVAPTISNLVAYRSTSEGVESDDDTSARVKFNYTIPQLDHQALQYTIEVGYKEQSNNVYTYTDSLTGSNGIIDTILENVILAEQSYDIQAKITPVEQNSITRQTYVSEAYFIIDINSDGTGISFGLPTNNNDFYQALTLTTAPTDWSTTYANYYIKDNNTYVLNSDSNFNANTTYYEKIHNSLFKCGMDICLDLPNYQTTDDVDEKIYTAVTLLGWTEVLES